MNTAQIVLITGGLVLIASVITLFVLSYRAIKSAEATDFLEKHYEEFDAD